MDVKHRLSQLVRSTHMKCSSWEQC